MDRKLQAAVLSLLKKPKDKKALNNTIGLVRQKDSTLAGHLLAFVQQGRMYPEGYSWTGEAKERLAVLYVLSRILPQHILVHFACDCAEEVLPTLESECPSPLPRTFINLTLAWVEGEVTKKVIK